MTTRIVVTGGRNFSDAQALCSVLDDALVEHGGDVHLAHGGARGADHIADSWARDRGVPCTVYAANWKEHGRGAGPRRNSLMLSDFGPDLVVACPGGRGTQDCVSKAMSRGVRVLSL